MADIVSHFRSGARPGRYSGLKQVGLLAGVAAAIAAAIWLVLWSQGQNYTVLYGQLSERESGQVMDALTAAASNSSSIPQVRYPCRNPRFRKPAFAWRAKGCRRATRWESR